MYLRSGKNSRWVYIKYAWHVTQWLASYYDEYRQTVRHGNATTHKKDVETVLISILKN